MKDHTLFTANFANGRNVLHHTDFVVHEHHAGQNRIGPDCGFEGFQIEQAIGLHIHVSDFKTLALQLAHGIQHRFVLGFHRDQMLAFGFVETSSALDGEVVGFGGARSPDDFARVCANQRRHLLTRLFHRSFRLPAPCMRARSRVAEMLAQPRDHRIHHPWVAGVGG